MCAKIYLVRVFAIYSVMLACMQLCVVDAVGVEVNPAEILSALPEDAIRSIDHPKFVSGKKADKQMDDDEQVIGLEVGGEAKAYPLYVLSSHEIVNDVIAGRPVAVTW
ncbi:MAG: DUF3179 domain-containing protein [Planctomycetes bacterium]|nr:DUF3179 domain-containing protein [Planctomycetota bacterium]